MCKPKEIRIDQDQPINTRIQVPQAQAQFIFAPPTSHIGRLMLVELSRPKKITNHLDVEHCVLHLHKPKEYQQLIEQLIDKDHHYKTTNINQSSNGSKKITFSCHKSCGINKLQ